jgi:hypothetical protein
MQPQLPEAFQLEEAAPSADPIAAITASEQWLLVARQSGVVQRYRHARTPRLAPPHSFCA